MRASPARGPRIIGGKLSSGLRRLDRKDSGNRIAFDMPQSVALLLHEREMLIDALGEFVQVLDSQPGSRERTDDVAEPVHPLVGLGNYFAVIRVVGAGRILAHRRMEVRNLELQFR